MNSDATALIVFAREPKNGKVKTRLLAGLPSTSVTGLYQSFIKDILRIARHVDCSAKYVFYVGRGKKDIPFLAKQAKGFILRRQSRGDLGKRMLGAFQHCYAQGYGRMVVVGTDCLTMTSEDLNKAFQKLKRFDVVLGPSKDGGYYLLGLRYPDPRLFQGISWSTGQVLSKTKDRLRSCRYSFSGLPVKEDIDTMDSLKRFMRNPQKSRLAPDTACYLKQIKALLFNRNCVK